MYDVRLSRCRGETHRNVLKRWNWPGLFMRKVCYFNGGWSLSLCLLLRLVLELSAESCLHFSKKLHLVLLTRWNK
uniref:Uncharacterized protein n=2 Tax=Anguilla anguilla TaxID=7936 RepID=A0A0E9PZW2_ANGAN